MLNAIRVWLIGKLGGVVLNDPSGMLKRGNGELRVLGVTIPNIKKWADRDKARLHAKYDDFAPIKRKRGRPFKNAVK